MLFNSPTFIVFFAVVFGLYWWLKATRVQNVLLLVASYVFYGTWSWKFLGLFVLNTLANYYLGLAIGAAKDPRVKRRLLVLSLAIDLGVLAIFKYANFFIHEASQLLTDLGLSAHPLILHIILPIGISFYTFQAIGYIIDIYRGKIEPTRSLLDFALFKAFFPQLVAGPIERATNLLTQIQNPRRFDAEAIAQGLQLMIWGLFKKIVIADNLAPYVDRVYQHPTEFSGGVLLTATVFFAFQIYCDFSGYSDIARGSAQTLGFRLINNFNFPYFSKTPVEFWQRWHISLSTWFQDYLYFPLAMHYVRKGGWLSQYKAHIYAMALIGLWHGANWTFVAFGVYWGLAIVGFLILQEKLQDRGVSVGGGRFAAALAMAAMLVVAGIGWMLFRAESIADFGYILTHLGATHGESAVRDPRVADLRLLWALVIGFWLAEWVYFNFRGRSLALLHNDWLRFAGRHALLVLIVFCYVVSRETGVQPFIYFQF